MSTDQDFDRITQAWLAEGPESLSDRVIEAVVEEIQVTPQGRFLRQPWSSMASLSSAAAIGLLLAAGAFVYLTGPGRPELSRPGPNTTPSPAATSSTAATSWGNSVLGPLVARFTSTLNGYSVSIPADWTTTRQATTPWRTGTVPFHGGAMLDEVRSPTMRFVGTSQPIAPAGSADAWVQAEIDLNIVCEGLHPVPEQVPVGRFIGIIEQNGCNMGLGRLFDVLVVVGGRGYDLTMDGDVTHDQFLAVLATVEFDPASAFAVVPLPLDQTFVSPGHGYSIGHAEGWTITPATQLWVGYDNSYPWVDRIEAAGTDTVLTVGSQLLPAGTTFEQWIAEDHADLKARVPVSCDGGELDTWGTTPIGSETGRYYRLCDDAMEAVGEVGGRVYAFSWEHTTVDPSSHLDDDVFLSLLATVTFDPGSAADSGASQTSE
jgi:hypothetical protein